MGECIWYEPIMNSGVEPLAKVKPHGCKNKNEKGNS